MILVTAGAGDLAANLVLDWLATRDEPVLNRHALTYA
ncbi:MAG: dTDP-glucose 4,6-dehydratase, partial [Proteobacteria bacterium]|nr:dTDP-glucose 4,6-dehydratase [Pseudomonadota bacterium]